MKKSYVNILRKIPSSYVLSLLLLSPSPSTCCQSDLASTMKSLQDADCVVIFECKSQQIARCFASFLFQFSLGLQQKIRSQHVRINVTNKKITSSLFSSFYFCFVLTSTHSHDPNLERIHKNTKHYTNPFGNRFTHQQKNSMIIVPNRDYFTQLLIEFLF